MPELAKMKAEGLFIKGWGLGVNTLPPLLKTLEVAEPSIFLNACQYSLVFHEEALDKLLPKDAEKKVSLAPSIVVSIIPGALLVRSSPPVENPSFAGWGIGGLSVGVGCGLATTSSSCSFLDSRSFNRVEVISPDSSYTFDFAEFRRNDALTISPSLPITYAICQTSLAMRNSPHAK